MALGAAPEHGLGKPVLRGRGAPNKKLSTLREGLTGGCFGRLGVNTAVVALLCHHTHCTLGFHIRAGKSSLRLCSFLTMPSKLVPLALTGPYDLSISPGCCAFRAVPTPAGFPTTRTSLPSPSPPAASKLPRMPKARSAAEKRKFAERNTKDQYQVQLDLWSE